MSDFNEDRNDQPIGGTAPEEPAVSPEEPTTPVNDAPQEPTAPADNGWNNYGQSTYHTGYYQTNQDGAPVQPGETPPPPYQAPQNTYQAPQSPYQAPQSPYQAPQNTYQAPQTPYSPYGNWQQASGKPPKKKGSAGVIIGVVAGICAVAILVVACAAAFGAFGKSSNLLNNSGGNTTQSGSNTSGGNNASGGNSSSPQLSITDLDENATAKSTSDIVSGNIDSVAVITVYQQQTAAGYGGAFSAGTAGGSLQQAGSATGIVMSQDGYIITNCHVVVNEETGKKYDRVDVKMNDGTNFEGAEVIGFDSSTDLAVIKVTPKDGKTLKVPTFGDSSQMSLGDRVITIGNAGGLGLSVSQGIVSGLNRDVYEDTGYAIKCLQVDAAINPGNSGGPLFNALGQVIGINSAKISATDYEGLGFAIPIKEAQGIIDDLVQYGYVKGRVSLGVTGKTYSDGYYQGFLVYTIENGSPLASSSVKAGDLIVAVDGKTITSYGTLRSALATHKVGDSVKLKLARSANRQVNYFEVTVKLVEANAK